MRGLILPINRKQSPLTSILIAYFISITHTKLINFKREIRLLVLHLGFHKKIYSFHTHFIHIHYIV